MTRLQLGQKVKDVLCRAVLAENGPPGLVYGAMDRQGSLLALEAAGASALGSGKDMHTNALFPLFSMNKPLIVTTILHVIDKGFISLDEPVERVIPEIANVQILEDDGTLKPAQRKITMRMLLTHTSGFAYTIFNTKLRDDIPEFDVRFNRWTMPLVHEPGTAWEYGIGLDWASRVAERLVGLPFWDYAAQHIFEPLEIRDMAFRIQEHTKDKLVGLHERRPDGSLCACEPLPGTQYALANVGKGSLGAFGTVPDYLKLLVPYMNDGVGANGYRVFSSALAGEALRDQLAGTSIRVPETMKTMNLRFTKDVPLGPNKGWSLLGVVDRNGPHPGCGWWGGLGNLYWRVDKSLGVATVLMGQLLPFWDDDVLQAKLDLESAIYQSINNDDV